MFWSVKKLVLFSYEMLRKKETKVEFILSQRHHLIFLTCFVLAHGRVTSSFHLVYDRDFLQSINLIILLQFRFQFHASVGESLLKTISRLTANLRALKKLS